MVVEVAVRTFPIVGGAARDMFTAVPVVCNALALTKFVAPVIVLLVRVLVVMVLVFAIELIIGAVQVLFVRV
jgi:hypothetical protein